jgi:hypothetical protein
MDETEALSLLSLVSCAWPREKLSADSIDRVWLPRMLRQDPDIATQAFDLLISSDVFAPSYARYYETYVSIARRQPVTEITESSVTSKADALAKLRELRQAAGE